MRPVGSVRQVPTGLGGRGSREAVVCGFVVAAEERFLAALFVLLSSGRTSDRAFDGGHVLCSVGAERIECSGFDQDFERCLLQNLRVEPLGEIEDIFEGAVGGALGDDRFDGRFADTFDCGHAEADSAFIDDGEFGVGGVDVGRDDLDPHPPRVVGVFRDAVGVLHAARQQSGHELGGVVSFEVRRLVRDRSIGG